MARPATVQPLRIGLLSRFYPPRPGSGGIARYVQELAHGLAARGHQVHVLTESTISLRRPAPGVFVHGVVERERVPLAPGLPVTDRNLRWSLALLDRVVELARAGSPLDIVESPNWDAEGTALRRSALVPLVVRLHTPLPIVALCEGWPPCPDLCAAAGLERWLVEQADGVSSSTDAVANSVRDTLGVDRRSDAAYAKIPLGIDPGPRPTAGRSERAGQILFVGRLERRKGIHTLLEAVPALLRDDPSLRVDIVGDDTIPDPDGETVRERFVAQHRDASWSRRCRFHGTVGRRRLDAFYRRCTVFVAPSLNESFGLIYLEAMRHGKPVIGCDVGGVPEVVHHDETGLLVPAENSDALAGAIRRLLDDVALRRRLGVAARRAVEAEFSAERMASETAAFYRRLLEAVGDRYRARLACVAKARQPVEIPEGVTPSERAP